MSGLLAGVSSNSNDLQVKSHIRQQPDMQSRYIWMCVFQTRLMSSLSHVLDSSLWLLRCVWCVVRLGRQPFTRTSPPSMQKWFRKAQEQTGWRQLIAPVHTQLSLLRLASIRLE